MRKACIVVSPDYEKNRIFDLHDKVLNRDNCLHVFHSLKNTLQKHDINLATQDIHSIESSEFVIYIDMPGLLPGEADVCKSYLIIFESEVVRPDNWDKKKHECFRRIFTWNDSVLDSEKYIKLNYSYQFPSDIKKDLLGKTKLCALIAGRKGSKHPLELYSKRLEAIRWFERNHPGDFDLYGMGWEGYRCLSRKWSMRLNEKVPFLAKLLSLRYPSYRGQVNFKKPILEQYKFSICYENARDIPGYITEKIFDCFFAGCVPVYWGADNVTDHIPGTCFLDKRSFKSYETLYHFIKTMSDTCYLEYLHNIETYLKSEQAHQFTSSYFTKTIAGTLLRDCA